MLTLTMSWPAKASSFLYKDQRYKLAGLYSPTPIHLPKTLLDEINDLIIIDHDRYKTPIVLPIDKKNNAFVHTYLLEKGHTYLTGEDIIWRDKNYTDTLIGHEKSTLKIWDANSLNIPCNQFIHISGVIHKITIQKKRVFINFSQNWKEDFSLIIPKKVWKKFYRNTLSKNNKIFVRGFCEKYYGPMIKVHYKNQIKKLD